MTRPRSSCRGGETHHETPETLDRGDTEGIGDLTLFGQYRFYGQDTGLQASLLTGIKTPTGETGEHDDQGELFEAEFQPGSGSWDPMFGLALSQAQGGGRLTAMSCTRSRRTERNTPISVTASITMAR